MPFEKMSLSVAFANTVLLFLFISLSLKAQRDPWLVIYDQDSELARTVSLNRKNNQQVLHKIALSRATRLYLAAYPFDGLLPGNELNDTIETTFAQDVRLKVRESNIVWNGKELGDQRPEVFLNDDTFQMLTKRGRVVFRAVFQRFDSKGKETKFLVQGQAVPATMVSDNPLGVYFEKFQVEEI